MDMSDVVAGVAAVVAIILGQVAFRSQRVPLNLTRDFCQQFGFPDMLQQTLHRALTPAWAAPVDSAGKVMVLAVMGWLAYNHWWTWSILYLVASYVVGFIWDFVSPWPSVNCCLRWSRARLDSGDYANSSESREAIKAPEWQQLVQSLRDLIDYAMSHPHCNELRFR